MTEKHIVRVSIGNGIDVVKKIDSSIEIVIKTETITHSWILYHPDWATEKRNIEFLEWAERIFMNIQGYST